MEFAAAFVEEKPAGQKVLSKNTFPCIVAREMYVVNV